MILRPGIRNISDTIRACGFDQHYGIGELTPNMIGDFEIISLLWRDYSFAQLVVRGEAPNDLFSAVTIHLPDRPFVLSGGRALMTVHGDRVWEYRVKNPGAHGGDFAVEVS